jgi:hypothetical protein
VAVVAARVVALAVAVAGVASAAAVTVAVVDLRAAVSGSVGPIVAASARPLRAACRRFLVWAARVARARHSAVGRVVRVRRSPIVVLGPAVLSVRVVRVRRSPIVAQVAQVVRARHSAIVVQVVQVARARHSAIVVQVARRR